MICPVCGAQIEENVAFCTQCGSPVQNNATPEFASMEDHPTELFSEETPAYDTAPVYETPAYDAAPVYEAPAYDAAPSYDAVPEAPAYSDPYTYSDADVPASDPGAGLGKVSKILGIVGLLLMCASVGAPLSITALILGCIGLKKSKEAGFENKSAKIGRALGIVGIIFIPIIILIGVAAGTVVGLAESGMF